MFGYKEYTANMYDIYYENESEDIYYEIFSNIIINFKLNRLNTVNMIYNCNGFINIFERIVFNSEKDAKSFIEKLTAFIIINKLSEVN